MYKRQGQKCIYFAAGDDTDRLGKLPNAQLVLSKGYDLLLCTEDVDEDVYKRQIPTCTPTTQPPRSILKKYRPPTARSCG